MLHQGPLCPSPGRRRNALTEIPLPRPSPGCAAKESLTEIPPPRPSTVSQRRQMDPWRPKTMAGWPLACATRPSSTRPRAATTPVR
uniref:Uncharacterized protein n=1 Tax=Arundo donax TaxID=35708 RepID=A0A0A9FYV1_ARUDO